MLALLLCACTALATLVGCQNAGDIESGAAEQDFPVKRKEDFFIEQIKYYYSEQSPGNCGRAV